MLVVTAYCDGNHTIPALWGTIRLCRGYMPTNGSKFVLKRDDFQQLLDMSLAN